MNNWYLKSKNSTGEVIIDILSQQWPLSLKEIFYAMKNKYGKNVTYQAVHKALHLLIEDKIIISETNAYRLNIEWIKDKKNYFNKLDGNYEKISPLSAGIPTRLEFNTYFEMYSFMCDALYEETIDPKGLPICFLDSHWWNTIMTEEQTKKMQAFTSKHEFYCVAKPGGPADQMFMKFFSNYGMHCTSSSKIQTEHGTVVIGDVFIQIFYPTEIEKLRDEIANKSIDQVDLKKMQGELLYKKAPFGR
ncbi:MAG: hypothetical protein AABX04_02190 [Nanoarchaeota archaeon]